MKKINRLSGLVTAATLALSAGAAHAEWELNLTRGVTEISRDVYDMHMFVLWICVVIGIVVFGAMTWSMIHHRKSKGVTPAKFHHSTMAEVIWTVIPFLILIAMAIPAAKTLVAMEDTSNSDITVKVTGHQWKWEYEYLDSGVRFISSLDAASREAAVPNSGIDPESVENYLLNVDNPMVVPVNQKVRLVLTASDVIHAWWVPEFALKKDAIPGFINEMWFLPEEIGTYRGQCAELCGKDHGFMPIVVEVKSEEDYNAWVDAQLASAGADAADADREWAMDELMERGEKEYATYCAACHQANGEGIAGVFPALKGSEMVLGDLAAHIDIVLNGKTGTAMQAFANQLNDAQVASILTYQRNAWGNDTGEAIQPAQVKDRRIQ